MKVGSNALKLYQGSGHAKVGDEPKRCLLSEAGAAAAGCGRALYPCDSSSRCSVDRDFGSKTFAEGGLIEESQFLLAATRNV